MTKIYWIESTNFNPEHELDIVFIETSYLFKPND